MKAILKNEVLREFLLKYNLTQQKFAKICHLSEASLTQAFQGKEVGATTRAKILRGMIVLSNKRYHFDDVFYIEKEGTNE